MDIHQSSLLYVPPDVEEAWDTWRASCGPCALAAILHRPVMAVQDLLPTYAMRQYMNPTHMQTALRLAARPYVRRQPQRLLPEYGLVFVQWTGPWTKPGVPMRVAYRYTHWIGMAWLHTEPWVYDVNAADGMGAWILLDDWREFWVYDVNAADGMGAWILLDDWREFLVPRITKQLSRADGGYTWHWACDVQPTPSS